MTCWYHTTPSKLCDKCMDDERRRLETAPVGGIEYLATPVTCAAPGWARVDLPADQSAKLPEPRIHADQVYVMSQPGFEQHFARLFDAHKDSGPPGCECPPCADRREQRAVEFTEEKRRDRAERFARGSMYMRPAERDEMRAVQELCGFAARMATPWPGPVATVTPWVDGHSGHADSMRYVGVDLGHAERSVMTVTSVDREKGVVTFSSGEAMRPATGMANLVPGMEMEKPRMVYEADALEVMVGPPRGGFANLMKRVYADGFEAPRPRTTFRLGARGCHVGATVRHRADPLSGLMRVTSINSSVNQVTCVDASGEERLFALDSGWLVLVDGSGR